MSFEGNPKPKTGGSESLRERVPVAAFDQAIKMFQKEFEGTDTEVSPETLKDILYGFFEAQVANASRFESKEQGVSFIYSSVDSSSIAKKLYAEYAGALPELQEGTEQKETKRELLFESFITPENPGAFFTFFEQALHHVIAELPAAIADIKDGREPKRHEVYFAGHPTRDLGHITPEFVESLKDNHAFEKYGEMYAEFAEQLIASEPDVKTKEIFLRGISMGAPQAIETAKKLISDGTATQSREEAAEKNLPFLTVRIDTAPGESDIPASRRKWQIPAGFVAHGLQALLADPYVRATSNPLSKFGANLAPVLEERGFKTEMSPEDAKLKKEAIRLVHENLYAGVPIPENLKVTEVVGLSDLTMFSPQIRKNVAEQSEEHDGSLGEQLATRKSDNRRVFGVHMGHNIPNFVPNELGRLRKAAEALEGLKENS